MARSLTFAFPGDINTLTGGYLYDKRVMAELTNLGWQVDALSLDDRFPWVCDSTKERTARHLSQVDTNHYLVVDGLALGVLGHYAELIARNRPFTALVHHPLALESGLDRQTAKTWQQSEQAALAQASHIIVTSNLTRLTLIDQFAVAASKVTVIMPGVDIALRAAHGTTDVPTSPNKKAVELLSVGSLVPRKGFDVLVQSLAQIKQLDWHLSIIGDDQRAPDTASNIRDLIADCGLVGRIDLLGAQPNDVLNEHYQAADVFVLASRYEGYGMAYAEAMTWGLPVIGTQAGAARDTLAWPGAIAVAVDDQEALANALKRVVSEPALRHQMRLAALEHAKGLLTWEQVGEQFACALISQMSNR